MNPDAPECDDQCRSIRGLVDYDVGANSFLRKTQHFSEFTENLEATLNFWINLNLTLVYRPGE